MTKYESLTLSGVAVAIVISVISPIANYVWLDTNEKENRERAKFIVVRAAVEIDEPLEPDAKHPGSDVTLIYSVRNIGHRPADGLLITVIYPEKPTDAEPVSFAPPLPSDVKVERGGTAWFYTVGSAIAPDEELAISAKGPVVSMDVWTKKYGDHLQLYQAHSGGSNY